MTKSLEYIQLFLFSRLNVWRSGEYKYMIVSVVRRCDILTALDPPFERLYYEDYNGGFCFKGGKYSPRYLHQKIDSKCDTKLPAEKEFK